MPTTRRSLTIIILTLMLGALAAPYTALAATPTGKKMTIVVIKTNMGEIEIELDAAKAPKSVENFLKYVDKKHYDGTIFHRVISGFMIQGGGFKQDMTQKPTDAPIAIESMNGLKNKRGTLAMARTGDPNSATSQFFINHADNAFLDYRDMSMQGIGYTVFGKVSKGMDIVDAIARIPTGNKGPHQNVPQKPVIILEIVRTNLQKKAEAQREDSSQSASLDYLKFVESAAPVERMAALCSILAIRMNSNIGMYDRYENVLSTVVEEILSDDRQILELVSVVAEDVRNGTFDKYEDQFLPTMFGIPTNNATAGQIVIHFLYRAAILEDSQDDIDYIYRIGNIFGFDEKQLAALFAHFNDDSDPNSTNDTNEFSEQNDNDSVLAECYQIMGLSSSASIQEVKVRYRELVQQLHPDKVAHVNVEVEKLVTEKFQKIQVAFERISKSATTT